MRPLLLALLALTVALPVMAGRPSNVTRGVYVHSRDLMAAHVWAEWGDGFEFVAENPRSGETCIRVTNEPGERGGGAGQSLTINQQEPAPLMIAGWSRSDGVDEGEPGFQYSIYVDLRYTDGESLYMQIAPFERGTSDWHYSETIVEPEKPVASARYYVFLRDIGGTAWFDDIFFGEPGGENLLRLPGFEHQETEEFETRREVLARLDEMRVNAVHTYMGAPDDERRAEAISELLGALADEGIGVTLTPHVPYGTFSDADDPAFPSYYCVNNDWGDRWVEACRALAQFPFMGISVVPDEYGWNTGRLKRAYESHRDERVREFYAELPNFCNCDECRGRFERDYGMPLPPMGQWSRPPEQSDAYRNFIDFRYRSTTDLIRRAVDAVHSGPWDTAADSLINVSPICFDFRLGTGVAWDMIGYHTNIDFPTTDPYILLHNYLGDSTHWYVTETAMHLAGSTPKRQCGIVLEAGKLRPEHRALLPVEIYGSALSAVARGAKEIAFWHYTHITQQTEAGQSQGDSGLTSVRGVYELLERIDPWLEGAEPVRRVALLYSRASEEYFSFYTHPEPNLNILTQETDDPRYPFLAQKEVLYYLLRAGVPTDLYYLDQVSAEELADYEAIIVPFPFAVSEQQAAMLETLVDGDRGLIVISEFGSVDERGVPHERPVLLDLLGLQEAPRGRKIGELEILTDDGPEIEGEFSVYDLVIPAEDAGVLAMVDGTAAITARPVGVGGVMFMAGEFGIGLPANYDNEARDRTVRILPSELSKGHAGLFNAIFEGTALLRGGVAEDDVELALMRNAAGDLLLFAINWEEHPVSLEALLPQGGAGIGYRLVADGTMSEIEVAATAHDNFPHDRRHLLSLELEAQEAVVLRFAEQ